MFHPMKWIPVIILVIIGALAAFVAVEYLTVSIHSLPSYIPGRKRGFGHYHKRGAVAALVAFVAFVVAGFLAYRNTRGPSTAPAGAGAAPSAGAGDASVDQILSSPPSEPKGTVGE
jgi:uncharacterized membrane protein